MLNIHPLYSSSSGNMFHIGTEKTNILLDVGVSYKAINEGLKQIDKSLMDISAVLITHEHVDHIKGLSLLCRKNNIPIYACGKTPKTPPPQAIIYAPYSNTTSDQNAASHQQAAVAPSPAAQHHPPTPQQPQLPVRLSQR